MNKVIKIAVWLVLIIWGINQSFNMISQANTVHQFRFVPRLKFNILLISGNSTGFLQDQMFYNN